MISDPAPTVRRATTDQVRADDRLAFWDAYNTSALIGLRTSSLSEGGLRARQANAALRDMHIAEIEANDHVIERNPRLVTEYPKDSVFACHLLSGTAYFVQNGKQYAVQQYGTIIYDTRRPFTYGFPSDMHQLLIDVPIAAMEEWGIGPDDLPLSLSPAYALEGALAAEFRRTALGYLRHPSSAGADFLPGQTHTLLRAIVRTGTEGPGSLDRSVFHLLAAKRYIGEHLRESEMSPSTVAANVGVSVRHLNRLFAMEGASLGDYIWSQRAAGARHDLLNQPKASATICEIAFRWGFSSQAHFSRMIVSRYGQTPSEIRNTQPIAGR